MAKFKCSAESVGYLEEIVEARSEDKAWEIFEEDLEQGDVPEIGIGSIENKKVESVTAKEAKKIQEANAKAVW